MLRTWKKYFKGLMNEENERVDGWRTVNESGWMHRIIKEEVRAAVKRMRSEKAHLWRYGDVWVRGQWALKPHCLTVLWSERMCEVWTSRFPRASLMCRTVVTTGG